MIGRKYRLGLLGGDGRDEPVPRLALTRRGVPGASLNPFLLTNHPSLLQHPFFSPSPPSPTPSPVYRTRSLPLSVVAVAFLAIYKRRGTWHG